MLFFYSLTACIAVLTVYAGVFYYLLYFRKSEDASSDASIEEKIERLIKDPEIEKRLAGDLDELNKYLFQEIFEKKVILMFCIIIEFLILITLVMVVATGIYYVVAYLLSS